ncbi:hypothetical protein HNY73_019922 [Argiope bruennichi]|uniref:Uncharacterized protein n=1 Tax=Argiope bruennichi TaxID=94029 RepID=A0A8T0E554_ARGBR|nr:hypothetical protein HNY73_019922 [Argiope bruennichi]
MRFIIGKQGHFVVVMSISSICIAPSITCNKQELLAVRDIKRDIIQVTRTKPYVKVETMRIVVADCLVQFADRKTICYFDKADIQAKAAAKCVSYCWTNRGLHFIVTDIYILAGPIAFITQFQKQSDRWNNWNQMLIQAWIGS